MMNPNLTPTPKPINLQTKGIKDFLEQDEKKDLLRLLTAGSVDDGKSTLIGRLLNDSKRLYDDQLEALVRDSKRVGNAGEEIDYALLLDGLKAEREQGITIDVAYRYFSTSKRKFIIADTPGHEQYTRNMVTGASTAHLAIVLIDARKGVITQPSAIRSSFHYWESNTSLSLSTKWIWLSTTGTFLSKSARIIWNSPLV